ncbi:Uncharacterised protein [uncultured archaeon]|nr:Uncharacterised protein [uncultured archaeon]
MVGEICEFCGNKFDKRGMVRHRESCRKRKQKEQENAMDDKGKAAREAQIRDLLKKVKLMEHMIEDLNSQVVEMIKEVE